VEVFRKRLLAYGLKAQANYQELLAIGAGGEETLPRELWNIRVLTVCLEADLEPKKCLEFLDAAKLAALVIRLSLSINVLVDPGLSSELLGELEGRWTVGDRLKANLGLAWPKEP
jgi:hypothetical protein